jgi:GNAT superfamily N-acetyltransferase
LRNLHPIGQAEPTMSAVRRAEPRDRERSVASVVAAFAVDPLLRWVWPADDRYLTCAPAFFGLLLDLRLEGGEVWVADDGDAVAMWDPPGGLYGPPAEARWAVVQDGFTATERTRWEAFDTVMKVPDGTPPRLYLGVLATTPARQGQGLGRAVLGPILGAADRAGLATWLETASEANVRFYAGLGFTLAVEADVPGGGPHCWLLRRGPGAGHD